MRRTAFLCLLFGGMVGCKAPLNLHKLDIPIYLNEEVPSRVPENKFLNRFAGLRLESASREHYGNYTVTTRTSFFGLIPALETLNELQAERARLGLTHLVMVKAKITYDWLASIGGGRDSVLLVADLLEGAYPTESSTPEAVATNIEPGVVAPSVSGDAEVRNPRKFRAKRRRAKRRGHKRKTLRAKTKKRAKKRLTKEVSR